MRTRPCLCKIHLFSNDTMALHSANLTQLVSVHLALERLSSPSYLLVATVATAAIALFARFISVFTPTAEHGRAADGVAAETDVARPERTLSAFAMRTAFNAIGYVFVATAPSRMHAVYECATDAAATACTPYDAAWRAHWIACWLVHSVATLVFSDTLSLSTLVDALCVSAQITFLCTCATYVRSFWKFS